MNLQFGQPELSYWGLLVPILILLLFITERRRQRLTRNFVDPAHWSRLMTDGRVNRRYFKHWLVVVGSALIIVALVGPQWGYTFKEVHKKGVDIFVLVDTSLSMMAQDIKPNRLERSKRELIDLLGMLRGDRIGLIPFAGQAYVACPLTTDYQVFELFLDQLSSDLIPKPGTNIEGAVQLALQHFQTGPNRAASIILITDGEATVGETKTIIAKAKSAGVGLYVIGVGSPEGAPIPLQDSSGFKENESGQLILSKLDETSLRKMADETGGRFVRSVTGDIDLQTIYAEGIKAKLQDQDIASGQSRIPIERYQFPLALGFLFLLVEAVMAERRNGSTAPSGSGLGRGLLSLLLLLISPLVHASPWKFGDANKKYQANHFNEARQAYEKILEQGGRADQQVIYNLGNTYYRLGEYAKAEEMFLQALNGSDENLRERSLFNLGDAQFRQKKMEEALDSFEQTLAMNPDNESARANRDYVKKLLEEKKQKQNNQDQPQDNQTVATDEPKPKPEQGTQDENKEKPAEESESAQAKKPEQKEAENNPEMTYGGTTDVSKQEAEQLLDSLGEDTSDLIKDVIREKLRQQPSGESGHDW